MRTAHKTTAALIALSMVSCASAYFPPSLQKTPSTELVRVVIPKSGWILGIDGQPLRWFGQATGGFAYTTAGSHKITMHTSLILDPRYALFWLYLPFSGPVYLLLPVFATCELIGEAELTVSAGQGQIIEFLHDVKEPGCKETIDDYYDVRVYDPTGEPCTFSRSSRC